MVLVPSFLISESLTFFSLILVLKALTDVAEGMFYVCVYQLESI
jgi:hypothetical protein